MPRSRRRAPGEGSVVRRTRKRRDGSKRTRYQATITTGWADGRQQRLEGPLRETERQATRDLAELRRQQIIGVLPIDDPPLEDYLAYWLEQIEPTPGREANRQQVSRKTWRGYSGDVDNHIVPRLGWLKLSKLEPMRLQAWQRTLEREHSPYVARSAAATLSSALTRAARWQLMPRNPYTAGAVLRPTLPRAEASFWEPSEAGAFIRHETVTAHPLYIAYYLALNLGLRLGELRGLQWGDLVDLRDREGNPLPHVHVQRQAIDDRAVPTLTTRLKTSTSDRFIPLPRSAVALLEDWRIAQAAAAGSRDMIVTMERGTSPSTGYVRKEFYALCEAAGVRRIKLHELRHTAGSLWLEAGIPLMRVSRWLGHSDTRVTERVYIHLLREADHGESLDLDRMIGGLDGAS